MCIMQLMERKHLRESDHQVLNSPYVYESPQPFNGSKEVRILSTLSTHIITTQSSLSILVSVSDSFFISAIRSLGDVYL